jgi:predicted amidophosphoribosyltransferase
VVASRDVALAQRAVEAHWEADLSAEARERSRAVIDLDAEENACPACGAQFRTSAGRCGDCGLRFG